MKCEFCHVADADVEGWFYHSARKNPYAQGTADAGLLQRRVACNTCAQEAIDNNMTPAKKIT